MYVITNVFSDILIWICICKWHRGSYLLAGQPYSFASSIALQNWSIGLFKLILSSFAFAKSAFGHGVLRNVLWKEVRRVLSDVRLMLLVKSGFTIALPCVLLFHRLILWRFLFESFSVPSVCHSHVPSLVWSDAFRQHNTRLSLSVFSVSVFVNVCVTPSVCLSVLW